jgi:hypothetical protein
VDLKATDLAEARVALEKVLGSLTPAQSVSSSTKLIGLGAETSVDEINRQLKRLRGADLFSAKKDYFTKMSVFLAGMPSNGRTMSVTLSVNKEKLKDIPDPISTPYSYMPISQGGKVLREANLIGATSTDSTTIEYSGGDVTLAFRERQGAEIKQTETFSGPWGVLRLLVSPNVKSVARDGNKWNVEYKVTTPDKRVFTLWLILEFKQALPDVKDWPMPPTVN